jgi:hypothetical protein
LPIKIFPFISICFVFLASQKVRSAWFPRIGVVQSDLSMHREENMFIPSYQIRNVLKVYSRKLIRQEDTDLGEPPGEMNISVNLGRGKRAAILRRISAEIVKRMTEAGAQEEPGPVSEMQAASFHSAESGGETDELRHVFIYNTIGRDLCKLEQKVSEPSPLQLMDRLNHLAEKRNHSA